MTHRIIPAIMSGGAGTRLWPLSTADKPKQFHALMGPRTLFAETVARVQGEASGVAFSPPLVLCGENHVAHVKAALAEIGGAAAAIIVEPASRNTADVAAAAAGAAQEIEPGALVLLLPSDHVIADVEAFHAAITRAAPFAADHIVTFGLAPTRPSIDYGYIKQGASLGDGAFAVDTFKEKPDEATARAYLAAGGHTWNSGMFLFSPATLLAEFGAHEAIKDCAIEALRSAARSGDELRLGAAYAQAPSLPLDIAVMERTSRAAVIPCDLGWADIGSWPEVWRLAPRGPDGFAVLGAAAAADTTKMQAGGVNAIAVDGADLVVVAAPRGLLIVPRGVAADVRELRKLAAQL